ncbi:hypothetical protein ACTFIZ_012876 [Dictyostelium cf. discoideum]
MLIKYADDVSALNAIKNLSLLSLIDNDKTDPIYAQTQDKKSFQNELNAIKSLDRRPFNYLLLNILRIAIINKDQTNNQELIDYLIHQSTISKIDYLAELQGAHFYPRNFELIKFITNEYQAKNKCIPISLLCNEPFAASSLEEIKFLPSLNILVPIFQKQNQIIPVKYIENAITQCRMLIDRQKNQLTLADQVDLTIYYNLINGIKILMNTLLVQEPKTKILSLLQSAVFSRSQDLVEYFWSLLKNNDEHIATRDLILFIEAEATTCAAWLITQMQETQKIEMEVLQAFYADNGLDVSHFVRRIAPLLKITSDQAREKFYSLSKMAMIGSSNIDLILFVVKFLEENNQFTPINYMPRFNFDIPHARTDAENKHSKKIKEIDIYLAQVWDEQYQALYHTLLELNEKDQLAQVAIYQLPFEFDKYKNLAALKKLKIYFEKHNINDDKNKSLCLLKQYVALFKEIDKKK